MRERILALGGTLTVASGEGGVTVEAEFDFRQKGEQSWDIELFTTTGRLKLSQGGSEEVDGVLESACNSVQ